MSGSSFQFEVGESLYDRENNFYIPEMANLLDGREGLTQSDGESQPIEEINRQSEEPMVENEQVYL